MSSQHNRLRFALLVGLTCPWALFGFSAAAGAGELNRATVISAAIPSLRKDNQTINEAFRIAIVDLPGNVQPFRDGLLERPVPVILAGLHYDTPWPQIQGFWAEAAARAGKSAVFGHELFNLAAHAQRAKQFAEIYHPLTGEVYGGLQEDSGQGIVLWKATSRQTWAATAYLRMALFGLVGLRFETGGVRFQPCLPDGIARAELRNVSYRRMQLDIAVRGSGTELQEILVNGQKLDAGFLAADREGKQEVAIRMGKK